MEKCGNYTERLAGHHYQIEKAHGRPRTLEHRDGVIGWPLLPRHRDADDKDAAKTASSGARPSCID